MIWMCLFAILGDVMSWALLSATQRLIAAPMTYRDMGRLIGKLGVAKRRFLQIEYLGFLDRCPLNPAWRLEYITDEGLDTLAKLELAIDQFITGLESVVSRKTLKQLDAADPLVYTMREYGTKLWREIELPWGVDDLFTAFVALHNTCLWSGNHYYVEICDLSDGVLGFCSHKAAIDFIHQAHVAPASLYKSGEERLKEVFYK